LYSSKFSNTSPNLAVVFVNPTNNANFCNSRFCPATFITFTDPSTTFSLSALILVCSASISISDSSHAFIVTSPKSHSASTLVMSAHRPKPNCSPIPITSNSLSI
jgi:hypothetical protein